MCIRDRCRPRRARLVVLSVTALALLIYNFALWTSVVQPLTGADGRPVHVCQVRQTLASQCASISFDSTGAVSPYSMLVTSLADTPDILARLLRECRACRATSQFSLLRAYLIGRPAVCCDVYRCPFVRVSCRSPILRARHARLVADKSLASS